VFSYEIGRREDARGMPSSASLEAGAFVRDSNRSWTNGSRAAARKLLNGFLSFVLEGCVASFSLMITPPG